MSPDHFVYKQVLSGALRQGAKETMARNHAVQCLDNFKKGRITVGRKKAQVGDLINHHIKMAVKESKR